MAEPGEGGRARDEGPLVALTRSLAVAGGLLMLLTAIMVVVSVVMRWLISYSIPGDIELVQIATALAVFSFLPLCQAHRGNIVVDTFTTRLPRRFRDALDVLWDLVYALMAAIIAWRLVLGAYDTLRSNTVSMMLALPVGWAIAACAVMAALLAAVAVVTAFTLLREGAMSGLGIAATGFAVMCGLIALRMPVGLAMLVVGSVGYLHLAGAGPFLNYMKSTPYYLFSNYTLSVIPLFILMGAFAERSGLARDLFSAARAVVGHMRGGLAYSVIGACTIFGAICGSSVATTATFGRAALPELRRYGYEPGLATGTIAIGGVVDLMIPPSIILVVYAIVTEQNIAKLFQAALIPGLLAVALYCAVIAIVVHVKPALAPTLPKMAGEERVRSIVGVWPAVLVVFTVIGGIYAGIFTPTEAAAVGTVAMLLVGVLQRSLTWSDFKLSFVQTAETSAMIFAILLGAEVFDAFLALSQLPQKAAELVGGSGLSPYGVMFGLLIFYILLGAVMDELAMILLTLPVFFPIVTALDFGMPADEVGIWFGILVLSVVGIGLTAPPIGLNVFVVSAIARDVPIAATYRGVLPFVGADIIRLAILTLFPTLSLLLVRALN